MYIDFEACMKPMPVFVYGSLMSGFHNHRLFTPGSIVSMTAGTVADAAMYANGYHFPYAVRAKGESIKGQVIIVNEADFFETLISLDMLEGYNGQNHPRNHYERVLTTVTQEDGTQVKAWMYLAPAEDRPYLASQLPQVANGDWRGWMRHAPQRDTRPVVLAD